MHHLMCVSGNGKEFSEDGKEIIFYDHDHGTEGEYKSLMQPIEYNRIEVLAKSLIDHIQRRFTESSMNVMAAVSSIKGDDTGLILDQVNDEIFEFKDHLYASKPTIEMFSVEHFKECVAHVNKEYQRLYNRVWIPYPGTSLGMRMNENTPTWLVQMTYNMCVAILETRKSDYYFKRKLKYPGHYEQAMYSFKCIEKLHKHCKKLLGVGE